jgi:cell fate regulator YaaT (PSP1 superfamily)
METIEVVRVKFLWPGKMYEFINSEGLALKKKERVVVEADDGGSIVGTVMIEPRIRARRKEDQHLTRVLRVATEQDLAFEKVSDEFRDEVKRFFETRLRARQIGGSRLIDIEKADGGRRLVVYFSNENRKFPVKDVAMELGHRFNMRIDLRSVGVRDAARLSGGIGKCGLSLCCSTWLPDFSQVSIRMAKDQGLSLEPDSISGQCGRLLCCLGYEHQNYVEMGLGLPKVGKIVVTPLGDARVVKLDILKGEVTVRTEEGAFETFKGSDVKRKFGPGNAQGRRQDEDNDNDNDSDADLDGEESPNSRDSRGR